MKTIGDNLREMGIDPNSPDSFARLAQRLAAAMNSGELTEDMIAFSLQPMTIEEATMPITEAMKSRSTLTPAKRTHRRQRD